MKLEAGWNEHPASSWALLHSISNCSRIRWWGQVREREVRAQDDAHLLRYLISLLWILKTSCFQHLIVWNYTTYVLNLTHLPSFSSFLVILLDFFVSSYTHITLAITLASVAAEAFKSIYLCLEISKWRRLFIYIESSRTIVANELNFDTKV